MGNLKANPNLTLSDIANDIGKSIRTVEKAAAKLVKEGRLKHVGPKKGGHWKIIADWEEDK